MQFKIGKRLRMKKEISIWLIMMVFAMSSQAKAPGVELKFDQNGKFKIIQFTDTHFEYGSIRSDSIIMMMKTVIEKEKPNLVVFTGDVVTCKNTRKGWLKLLQPLIDDKMPWAVVLGNHDQQYDLVREQIMGLLERQPYNMSSAGPTNVSGSGNYMLNVKGSKSDQPVALLYFFDSHAYPVDDIPGYDWIKSDQIQWYREYSQKMTCSNEKCPYPALAFFHIPLPEYNQIIDLSNTIGIHGETVCSPKINTGLFASMYEMRDVMGVFSGHDHNNNYIGCLHGICLAYGCVTGRECYGVHERGCRIIVLHEGERKFDSWILTKEGEKKYPVTYPNSFLEEKKQ